LTVFIANQFTRADERFLHPLDGASSGLFLKSIGGNLLSVLPSAGKGWIYFPELVNAGAVTAFLAEQCMRFFCCKRVMVMS